MTQTIDERLDAARAARDPADMGKVQDEIEKGRADAISRGIEVPAFRCGIIALSARDVARPTRPGPATLAPNAV